MAQATAYPRLTDHGQEGWHLHYRDDANDSLPDVLRAVISVGTAMHLTTRGIHRLSRCAAGEMEGDPCTSVVVDVTRNGRQRYCSVRCANRAAVRRHRAAAILARRWGRLPLRSAACPAALSVSCAWSAGSRTRCRTAGSGAPGARSRRRADRVRGVQPGASRRCPTWPDPLDCWCSPRQDAAPTFVGDSSESRAEASRCIGRTTHVTSGDDSSGWGEQASTSGTGLVRTRGGWRVARILGPGVLGVAPAQISHARIAVVPEGLQVGSDGGRTSRGGEQVQQERNPAVREDRYGGPAEDLLQSTASTGCSAVDCPPDAKPTPQAQPPDPPYPPLTVIHWNDILNAQPEETRPAGGPSPS